MPPIVPRSGIIRRTRPMHFGDSRLLIERRSLINIKFIYKPPLEGISYTFGCLISVVVTDNKGDFINDLVTMGGAYKAILVGGLSAGDTIGDPYWSGSATTSY